MNQERFVGLQGEASIFFAHGLYINYLAGYFTSTLAAMWSKAQCIGEKNQGLEFKQPAKGHTISKQTKARAGV